MLVFLLMALSVLSPLSARAGHWEPAVSGTVTSTDTGNNPGINPNGPFSWQMSFDMGNSDNNSSTFSPAIPGPPYVPGFPYLIPWDLNYLGYSSLSGYGFDDTSGKSGDFSIYGNPATEKGVASATVTFTWVPDPNLPSDPPPKGPVYLLEQAIAEGYSDGAGYSFDGSGTTAADGLGDEAVEMSADTSQWTDLISQGKHLVQRDGSSGTITMSGSPTATGSGSVSQPDGSGLALSQAGVGYSVAMDTRGLTISSGIETSYFKGSYDANLGTDRHANVRSSDGGIAVDSVLQWQSATDRTGASTGLPQGWAVNDSAFTANAVGFDSSATYSWTMHGQGNLFYPSRPTVNFSVLEPGDGASVVFDSFTAKVTDIDGTTASNNYTVAWHLPTENWTADAPGASYPSVIASEKTPGAAIYGTSGSGQWSFTEDVKGASVSLSDMFSVGAGLVDPPWAAFLAAAGVVFSKTQPEASPTTSVDFGIAWGSQYSTFDVPPADNTPATMKKYRMTPFIAVIYQPQKYHGDQYDAHGYVGITHQSFDKAISAEGCGHFTLI